MYQKDKSVKLVIRSEAYYSVDCCVCHKLIGYFEIEVRSFKYLCPECAAKIALEFIH